MLSPPVSERLVTLALILYVSLPKPPLIALFVLAFIVIVSSPSSPYAAPPALRIISSSPAPPYAKPELLINNLSFPTHNDYL